MKKIIDIPCRLSLIFMIYGSFAVFSQLIFMILHINILMSSHNFEMVKYICVPYLEYPLISIVLVLGGALLFDYIKLKE